jgi:hypothetical protein
MRPSDLSWRAQMAWDRESRQAVKRQYVLEQRRTNGDSGFMLSLPVRVGPKHTGSLSTAHYCVRLF